MQRELAELLRLQVSAPEKLHHLLDLETFATLLLLALISEDLYRSLLPAIKLVTFAEIFRILRFLGDSLLLLLGNDLLLFGRLALLLNLLRRLRFDRFLFLLLLVLLGLLGSGLLLDDLLLLFLLVRGR